MGPSVEGFAGSSDELRQGLVPRILAFDVVFSASTSRSVGAPERGGDEPSDCASPRWADAVLEFDEVLLEDLNFEMLERFVDVAEGPKQGLDLGD